uniref:Uncharacterized protein n=1 Tax=Anguilla anguilla TaxID=7936 RepID=A0A0E9THC4_ANGAN
MQRVRWVQQTHCKIRSADAAHSSL